MLHANGDAVVSCHVERVCDDPVWTRLYALLRDRPGGFAITPLLRPPHEEEDRALWLERARAAAELAPIGHHTHFAGPDRARPVVAENVARARREAEWLRAEGLRPSFYCGGGWYSDVDVAETAAEFGYVDCTALAFWPDYLQPDRRHLHLDAPARLRLPSGRTLLELPSTHSIGMILRALPRRLDQPLVHVYFHDTDLLDARRALAVRSAIRLLALRRRRSTLEAAARAAADAPELPFEDALRG